MKIGEYKQMMSNLTRPGTPEQNKKAEENNKKYLADRKAKTLKEYGLDKPLIVNNGNIQTQGRFVNGLKNGEWKYFYETGEIWKLNYFSEGNKVKNWSTFDLNGNKIDSINFN